MDHFIDTVLSSGCFLLPKISLRCFKITDYRNAGYS